MIEIYFLIEQCVVDVVMFVLWKCGAIVSKVVTLVVQLVL